MSTKLVPGQLVVADDAPSLAAEAARRLARYLADTVTLRGRAVLALSGGSTPDATLRALAGRKDVPWGRLDVVWVDERRVPHDHPRSNVKLARAALLDHVPVAPERVHAMPVDGELAEDAARYEATLRRVVGREPPAIDVVVLGIGTDGHTASLFPGRPEVHVVDTLVVGVPADGGREARLSLTTRALELARLVVVLAQGEDKRAPLERAWAVRGDLDETPARLLRARTEGLVWITDRAAAGPGRPKA